MFRNFSYYYDRLEDVNKQFQSVKIEGYTGHWSAIQKLKFDDDKVYYIFEHDYYGDETCYLVVRFAIANYTKVEIAELYETYDGLIQCLIDEDIIDTSCADWNWG